MTRERLHSDAREHILAVGEALVHGRSFTALGLTELLAEAKVPKGSFYHYFRSKEDFGVALLERYFAQHRERMAALLSPESGGDGRHRLLCHFRQWLGDQQRCDVPSCMVVKLAAEVSDLSEPMRLALKAGVGGIVQRLADCLRAGQADGSIRTTLPAEDTARALYSLWLGAALMVKTQHDLQPMHAAMAHTEQVLASPS